MLLFMLVEVFIQGSESLDILKYTLQLTLCDEDTELIFGKDFQIDDAFDLIDTDQDGKVGFSVIGY